MLDDYENGPSKPFGGRKPVDEYAMDVLQDSFERRLDQVISDRDKKPEPSVRKEISTLVCAPRRNKSYFSKRK